MHKYKFSLLRSYLETGFLDNPPRLLSMNQSEMYEMLKTFRDSATHAEPGTRALIQTICIQRAVSRFILAI